jgi:hydrocephalus-inducing protein
MPDIFGDQLTIEPMAGFVQPAARQPITLTLLPKGPFKAEQIPLVARTVGVQFEEAEDPSPKVNDDAEEDKEPPFTELEGTQRELPLRVSAAADEQSLECDIEDINFKPTVMFGTKLHRFKLKNPSSISTPFDWRVQGKMASAFFCDAVIWRCPSPWRERHRSPIFTTRSRRFYV